MISTPVTYVATMACAAEGPHWGTPGSSCSSESGCARLLRRKKEWSRRFGHLVGSSTIVEVLRRGGVGRDEVAKLPERPLLLSEEQAATTSDWMDKPL